VASKYQDIIDLSPEQKGEAEGRDSDEMKRLWAANIFALFDDAAVNFDWRVSDDIRITMKGRTKGELLKGIEETNKMARDVQASYSGL